MTASSSARATPRIPSSGRTARATALPIPRRPVRRRLQGLPRFVVTRGGEYGFMPGLRALRWLARAAIIERVSGGVAMFDVLVVGAGPAGVLAALRAADLGAQDRARHPRRVRRHGGERRTGAGADPGPCRPAAPRRAPARSVRHRRRASRSLDYPRLLRACARSSRTCAPIPPCASRSSRRGDRPRAGRHRAVRRPAHHRDRERTAAPGRHDHPLHRAARAGGSPSPAPS